jgi:hypothetical protein
VCSSSCSPPSCASPRRSCRRPPPGRAPAAPPLNTPPASRYEPSAPPASSGIGRMENTIGDEERGSGFGEIFTDLGFRLCCPSRARKRSWREGLAVTASGWRPRTHSGPGIIHSKGAAAVK